MLKLKPYNVLRHPHPMLRQKSVDVDVFDEALVTHVQRMFLTMKKHRGVGLASVQVQDPRRICIVAIGKTSHVFINPRIIEKSDAIFADVKEGCLSVGAEKSSVQRAKRISVEAYNVHGEKFSLTLENEEAVCFQHEYDHLDGVLYIDYQH